MYLCMFTQHSKTENKHHGHKLTTVTFIFNLIALKTLEQSMLLVHDIFRFKIKKTLFLFTNTESDVRNMFVF